MNTFQDLKYKFSLLDAFGKIIVINVILFILNYILQVLLKFEVFNYFGLPPEFINFLYQPWSIISYSFFHSGFFHLLFNMLLLYYVSGTITNLLKTKTVLNIYFLGVISGGIFFLIATNLLPLIFIGSSSGVLIGASAGVCALLMFIGIYLPTSSVSLFGLFTVTWRQIAIFFVLFDFLRLFLNYEDNAGGYIAHFGGYSLGFLYANQLIRGKDIGTGFERVMDFLVSWLKPKSPIKKVYRNNKNQGADKTKNVFNSSEKQKKIDAILDKISKSGYESLTKEEKEFLFKAGKD